MKATKIKKKAICALLALILSAAIFIALPISGFCYEGDAEGAEEESATAAPDENGENGSYETVAPDAEVGRAPENGTHIENNTEGSNVFAILFDYLAAHIGEIFSALAFLASVILMLCYKKGFLPLLKSGMNALNGGVKSLGEETKSIGGSAEALSREVSERLTYAEEILSKMGTTLDTLSTKLGNVEERDAATHTLKTVLRNEIDMMYEIFMAAALPQYLKEKVGEQVAKMHRAIDESEKENEA